LDKNAGAITGEQQAMTGVERYLDTNQIQWLRYP